MATAAGPSSASEPLTHYKITLRRSAISLPQAFKATLVTLGIHRRMQTVYHPHSPECAGKILKVKELVEVENVPASQVRTKTEQRQERKARRGYAVLSSKLKEDAFVA
jgi:large subunit ribosomal protein L30